MNGILCLKAAKISIGTWILLKFERETRTQPPTSPPKLLCRSCWFQFTSFWINLHYPTKRETDGPEITTFLPASDSLFGSRLICQQSYLKWSHYSLIFNEMGAEKPQIRIPQNTLCKQLMIGRRRCTILPGQAVFVNDATISGLQLSFLIQQHKGKRILC